MDESGRTSCSKYGSGESNDGWLEQQGMLGDAGGIGEGHSNRFMNKNCISEQSWGTHKT